MSQPKNGPNDPDKKRVRLYLCYPFHNDDYNDADKVQAALSQLIHRGFTPIMSSTYIVSTGYFSYDLMVIYSTIESCNMIALFHEEHCAQFMLYELMKARELGKPVIRIIKKGDSYGTP